VTAIRNGSSVRTIAFKFRQTYLEFVLKQLRSCNIRDHGKLQIGLSELEGNGSH